jgi:hypothetical protein
MNDAYTPPCGYCNPVAALRAAEEKPPTPLEAFEQRYKNMRTRQLALDQPAMDAHVADGLRALAEYRATLDATAPLSAYEPPDPYKVSR